jgi:hypothetical protein
MPLQQRAWLANVLAVHLFWTGAVGEARALIGQELAHLERNHAPDRGRRMRKVGPGLRAASSLNLRTVG